MIVNNPVRWGYLHMSISSERVKKWRRSTKDRIIKAMGGSCIICGYSKCDAALETHHLDSDVKDFAIGMVRASPKKWSAIVEELRKCVLLCANCHREVHNESAIIPNDPVGFNEDYADYREHRAYIETECPECGILKPDYNKFCSLRCSGVYSGRNRRRVDWDNVDLRAILDDVGSIQKTAELLGVSWHTIKKRLRKMPA